MAALQNTQHGKFSVVSGRGGRGRHPGANCDPSAGMLVFGGSTNTSELRDFVISTCLQGIPFYGDLCFTPAAVRKTHGVTRGATHSNLDCLLVCQRRTGAGVFLSPLIGTRELSRYYEGIDIAILSALSGRAGGTDCGPASIVFRDQPQKGSYFRLTPHEPERA